MSDQNTLPAPETQAPESQVFETLAPEPPYCPRCERICNDVAGYSSCCHVIIDLDAYEAAQGANTVRDLTGAFKRDHLSRFVGVTRHQGRWRASIYIDGKGRHLGSYDDEITAARVYDNAQFYLQEAGLVRRSRPLNFPEHYAPNAVRPPRYFLVTRILREVDCQRRRAAGEPPLS